MSIEQHFRGFQEFEYPYTPTRFKESLVEIMSSPDFNPEHLAYDIRTGLLGFIYTSDQNRFEDDRLEPSIAAMTEKVEICIALGLRDVLTLILLTDKIGVDAATARINLKDQGKVLDLLTRNNDSLDGYWTIVTDTIGCCLIKDTPASVAKSTLSEENIEKFIKITRRTDLLDLLKSPARKNYLESDLAL
jgi:hypothetical protein